MVNTTAAFLRALFLSGATIAREQAALSRFPDAYRGLATRFRRHREVQLLREELPGRSALGQGWLRYRLRWNAKQRQFGGEFFFSLSSQVLFVGENFSSFSTNNQVRWRVAFGQRAQTICESSSFP